jgi:hypothetical protein
MGRNYLLGRTGDATNAILAAAGHNWRIILIKFRLSWLCLCSDYCAICATTVPRAPRHDPLRSKTDFIRDD